MNPARTFAFDAAKFSDSLTRNADEADLSIVDEDTPAVPIGDRQDVIEEYITDYFGISAKRVGVDHLAGKVPGNGDAGEYDVGNLLVLPVGAAPPALGVDADEDSAMEVPLHRRTRFLPSPSRTLRALPD